MDASISESDDGMIAVKRSVRGRSNGEIIQEGVLAGMVAAAAVALVFLLVDLMAGEMFRTPQQLGTMLLTMLDAPSMANDATSALALYTLFHSIAFIIAGIVVAFIVQLTMQKPIAILLFVILFFAFEVVFTGFVAFLDVRSTTGITPMQVALGNIVATVAMGVFFVSRHPHLLKLRNVLEAEE